MERNAFKKEAQLSCRGAVFLFSDCSYFVSFYFQLRMKWLKKEQKEQGEKKREQEERIKKKRKKKKRQVDWPSILFARSVFCEKLLWKQIEARGRDSWKIEALKTRHAN